MVRGGWDAISHDDERMVDYIRRHREIRDVIVSGGDPLTLPTSKLKFSSTACATSRTSMSSASAPACRRPCCKLFDPKLIDILAGAAEKVWIGALTSTTREITRVARLQGSCSRRSACP
ncbi:MAG: hypothetical protein U0793_22185 [Gemmataceae bacterium]